MREIILDTETTGLDPKQGHRIIEIGALEMVDKILTGRSFHHYINPERDIPYEAFQIPGISAEYLKDKPKFHQVADEFLEFVLGGKLVIHNASFDMNFLNFELSLINKHSLDHLSVIDTLSVARRMFPGQKNNLDALCKRFKIDNSDRKYHGALKDAALLSEVYVELTGGRQIKIEFGNNSLEKEEDQTRNAENYDFKILKPSEEEFKAHSEFIQSLIK